MPGVSVRQADELCETLMKAGQTFNVAVKTAVEDWADQKLQGNELKKTISNWGHDSGHRDEERDEELRAAHGDTFELRCQLHTHRERYENIQFETRCIISEFEKLRVFDEDDEAYREGVMTLHKVWLPMFYVFETLPRGLTYLSVFCDLADRCLPI